MQPFQGEEAMARRMRDAARAALLLVAAAGLGLVLVQPPLPLAAAERLFQGAALHWLAPLAPPHPRLVLIGITEETLAAFPYRSPVDRGFLAGLVDTLAEAGVAAIGLDILLDRPTEPAKDAALRATVARQAVPTVLITLGPETPLPPERAAVLAGFTQGIPTGDANLARDRFDGLVRVHRPRHPTTGAPSFPAALAAAIGVAPPAEPFAMTWRRTALGPVAPLYPAEAVPLLPPDWLRGRVALIGSLLPGTDEHRSLGSAFGPPSFGLEIHAQVLAQILDGGAGAGVAAWQEGLATLGLAALGLLAGLRLSGRRLILALGLLGLAWPGAVLAATAAGQPGWPVLAPALAGLVAGGLARAVAGAAERRDRAVLHSLFARFLSAPVAEALLRDRELFLAGGRPKPQELTATVLFADIAGFTTICERLPPEPLIAWLDRYMDTMVQVVTAHGGVVLRFIGDGILAAFGVPVPRGDPAAIAQDAGAAARCALAMEQAMAALNAGWRAAGLPEAGLRIGIHTGPLVAGSLGHGERMEFCLLGDTANVGARLEQLGKQHGGEGPGACTIILGEPSWRLLQGSLPGLPIGNVALRNRGAPMAAWRIDSRAVAELAAVADLAIR
ncbi:adenylate/guanylate cyclase domain-containing protein [Roseicella frigidaeris]|nr:adenylate/guanylate cyclase domain-containing protein [Roseicella frigidaeris]